MPAKRQNAVYRPSMSTLRLSYLTGWGEKPQPKPPTKRNAIASPSPPLLTSPPLGGRKIMFPPSRWGKEDNVPSPQRGGGLGWGEKG